MTIKNYTKQERDAIVLSEGLVKHKTKRHLWKVDGKYRWANMNAYQAGVWFTDYSNGVNSFTDRYNATVPKTIASALANGAMPLAERINDDKTKR